MTFVIGDTITLANLVYKGNYWIEDKPENADAGIRCGFKTLLVEHGHNLDYKGPATVVKTWEEIYNIITK